MSSSDTEDPTSDGNELEEAVKDLSMTEKDKYPNLELNMDNLKERLKTARREFTYSRNATEEFLLKPGIDIDTLRAVSKIMCYRAQALEEVRNEYLAFVLEHGSEDQGDKAAKYEEEKKKQLAADVTALKDYDRISLEVEEKIASLLEQTEAKQPEYRPAIKFPLAAPIKTPKGCDGSGSSSTPLGQPDASQGEQLWRFRGEEIKYPRLHLPEFDGSSAIEYWNFLE